jgi:hypothetical protein
MMLPYFGHLTTCLICSESFSSESETQDIRMIVARAATRNSRTMF